MFAAKFLAVVFGFVSWILWRQVRRALAQRHVGPPHRRTHRDAERGRFFLRVAWRAAGALVCLVAAWHCLAEFRTHF
jgi:ABC-type nickel/cobalt efflux system permease component RcnA